MNYTYQELQDTLNDWWYEDSDEATEKWCQWHSYELEKQREWLKNHRS